MGSSMRPFALFRIWKHETIDYRYTGMSPSKNQLRLMYLRIGCVLIIVPLCVLALVPLSSGSPSWYSLQVGAVGDAAGNGNMGVSVQIQTNVYPVHRPDISDSFWVADTLENGAFIQLGYQIEPGYFCLRGIVSPGNQSCTGGVGMVGDSDARWFWQYWPNTRGSDYYYGKGPAGSVGSNGQWHTYTILSNSSRGWDFELDGKRIDDIEVPSAPSNSPPYIVAEKLTFSTQPGNLGPVQFKNLQYLDPTGKEFSWYNSTSFSILTGCGVGAQCLHDSDYGVTLEGATLIAGSGQNNQSAGSALPEVLGVLPDSWLEVLTVTLSAAGASLAFLRVRNTCWRMWRRRHKIIQFF